MSIISLIKLQFGIKLSQEEWDNGSLSKERCQELGVRSPKLSKALVALGVPSDYVATLLSGKNRKVADTTQVWGDDLEETALWDQGNSIHYRSCQATDNRAKWFDDGGSPKNDYCEIKGDAPYWGESLFIWAVGEPMSVDGEGFKARAKLRVCYNHQLEVAGLYIDRPYGQYNLLLDNVGELKVWWAEHSQKRGYPQTPILMPPLWQREDGAGSDFQQAYGGRYAKLSIPSSKGGYQDTLEGEHKWYDFFVDLSCATKLTTKAYKARERMGVEVWDENQNPGLTKKVWLMPVSEVRYNPQRGIKPATYSIPQVRSEYSVKLGAFWVDQFGYPEGKLSYGANQAWYGNQMVRDVYRGIKQIYVDDIHIMTRFTKEGYSLVVTDNTKGYAQPIGLWTREFIDLVGRAIENSYDRKDWSKAMGVPGSVSGNEWLHSTKNVYKVIEHTVTNVYVGSTVYVRRIFYFEGEEELDPIYEVNLLEVVASLPEAGFYVAEKLTKRPPF